MEVHGGWPSFHDAEVIELHYWRGRMKPSGWDDSNVLPVLTVKIHVFIEHPASHHALTTLRFKDVEDFEMEGFNHQNVILELFITKEERGENLPPWLAVGFQTSFGMSASFRCTHIEVVDAVRCTEDGQACE